jgi:hypothetical protein
MKAKKDTYIAIRTLEESIILRASLSAVVKDSGLSPHAIKGKSRPDYLVTARHYYWLLSFNTGCFTLVRLANLLKIDHGSLIHARNRHKNRCETVKGFNQRWERLQKDFNYNREMLQIEYERKQKQKDANRMVQK